MPSQDGAGTLSALLIGPDILGGCLSCPRSKPLPMECMRGYTGSGSRQYGTSGKPQTFKSSESEVAETLTGARIVQVRRVGKTVVMSLDRGERGTAEFLIHLGMTGSAAGIGTGGAVAAAHARRAYAERRKRTEVRGCAAVWAALGEGPRRTAGRGPSR